MANSRKPIAIFPDIPGSDKVVDSDGNWMPEWSFFFQHLIMALQTNYKPEGLFVPPLTTTNINKLTGTASHNNIVYDSDTNEFKGNVNGTWKVFLS